MNSPRQPSLFDTRDRSRRTVGMLQDFDLHFGRFIADLGSDGDDLMLAAALTANWNTEGHSCLDLDECAGGLVRHESFAEGRELPALGAWLKTIRSSSVVGDPGASHPLILDGNRLYLERYWRFEREVADELRARTLSEALLDDETLRAGLNRFFPGSDDAIDWQRVAAAVATRRNFCVISGGPGTGKTSTIVRILALLVTGRSKPLRVGLAAPTGKASMRMQSSIRQTLGTLGLSKEELAGIPHEALTLHRLLGARPGSTRFRHDRDNPLPLDLLIVDEASMIDLSLMARLLRALPADARLILLGDHNQLASVQAGAVLGDICSVADGFSRPAADWLSGVTGHDVPGKEGVNALSDSIVFLRRSYRFGPDSGIGALAREINDGDASGVRRVLEDPAYADVGFYERPGSREGLVETMLEGYAPLLEAAERDSAELFGILDQFRVLCGLREGPAGAMTLNQRLERLQRREDNDWYTGRPVLVTRNDYSLRLYNGDTGVTVFRDERHLVLFPTAEGDPRALSPGRLPEHETAFATTVHKAQGSEFDRVLLVLPPKPAPVLTRELIYTAVTRARRRVEIAGPPQVLQAAVEAPSRRASGLADALRDIPPA